MLPEKIFDTGEVVLNYAEGPPAGSPLVLVHGIPGRWQEFQPILPHLILKYHVYALDLRGQGKSGRTPGDYHSSVYGRDLQAFFDGVIQEPAYLLGMSAGGLGILQTYPGISARVKALILGNSPIDLAWLKNWMTSAPFKALFTGLRRIAGPDKTLEELAEEIAAILIPIPGQDGPVRYGDQPGVDPDSLKAMAIIYHHLDPDVLKYHAEGRANEYLVGFDLDRIYRLIECPVLLLQADPAQGGMMSDISVEQALTHLKNGQKIQLNTGHDLGLSTGDSDELLSTLVGFVDSVEGGLL